MLMAAVVIKHVKAKTLNSLIYFALQSEEAKISPSMHLGIVYLSMCI